MANMLGHTAENLVKIRLTGYAETHAVASNLISAKHAQHRSRLSTDRCAGCPTNGSEGRANQCHNLLGCEPQDPHELPDEHGDTCPHVFHK